jgi:opacity protein-like surface antigen
MKKFLLSLAVLAACLPINKANADQVNIGDSYVGIGGNLILPSDRSVSASNALLTGSGNLHFKTGLGASLFAGVHLSPLLAAEATLGYGAYDYTHLSGTVNGLTGSPSVSGRDNETMGLLNLLVTPFHSYGISPYIGGGIGAVYLHSKLNSGTIAGLTYSGVSDNKTAFGADGLVGADVALSKGFTLGGRYQYIWADTSTTVDSISLGDSKASIFTLRATYTF